MTTALSTAKPTLVCTRSIDGDEPYFAARQGGMTATDIRDWPQPAKRREILKEKVTGERDFRSVRAFRHGSARESYIIEWARAAHGVVPSSGLYAHPENPRHMCTPDGYLAGFSLEYDPGLDGVTVEVKTTTKDLAPGLLNDERVLTSYNPKSHFHKMKYMRQVQWQMYVMNANACLFIWEKYDHDRTDPETGNFIVTDPPEWCIIPRDQKMIDALVVEANDALDVIDAARTSGLPPVSDIPVEEAILLNDLFEAREKIATAEAAREKAWLALHDLYAELGEEFSEVRGFAQVTRSAGKPRKSKKFDRGLAASRAPKKLAEVEAFMARYTVEVQTPGKPSLSITDQRGKE